MRRLLFEHWNHTKKPSMKMIVPGKSQTVIKEKLARLKKAQTQSLPSRAITWTYQQAQTGACGAVLRSWFSLARNVYVKGLRSFTGVRGPLCPLVGQ